MRCMSEGHWFYVFLEYFMTMKKDATSGWQYRKSIRKGVCTDFLNFYLTRPKIMIIICLEKEYKKERTPDGVLSSRST